MASIEEKKLRHLNRRELLKVVSAATLVGVYARPAAAQSVKWSTGTEPPKLKAPAGAKTIEFPTASHVGGITLYANQFAQLIERAVEATVENEQ